MVARGHPRDLGTDHGGASTNTLIRIIQVIIALAICNVWLLRARRPTQWRGGDARTLEGEFRAYGLPVWFMRVVGFFKLLFAALLILGIWFPVVTRPAAAGMAVLMLGAVSMHIKVKDPVQRSLPALTLLVLCVIVAAA